MAARRDLCFPGRGNFFRRGHDHLKIPSVCRRHHVAVEPADAAWLITFSNRVANGFRSAEMELPATARPQEKFHEPLRVKQRGRARASIDHGFIAGNETVLALQGNDKRNSPAGFFRSGHVVAVEQPGRLKMPVERGWNGVSHLMSFC